MRETRGENTDVIVRHKDVIISIVLLSTELLITYISN